MAEQKPIRLLYMEDDQGLAFLLRNQLESQDFTVDVAYDGDEGISKFAKGEYDVILVDYFMPSMTGLGVIQHLAIHKDVPPMIMLTGAGSEELAAEAMRSGADDYVVKDVNGDYLKILPSVIHQILRERELTKAHRQAEIALEMERARSRLLATFIEKTSHEFRTPLSIIMSNIELLRRTVQDEKALRRVDLIYGQSQEILQLVESLLGLTRLDALQRLETLQLNINVLLQESLKAFQEEAAAKQVDLIEELSASPLDIQVAPEEFQIAINQILDNAIHFTEPGGKVTLRSFSEGHTVVVEVEDTGVGIAPQHLPHVFERFYREDRAHSTRGFGLGLPLVNRIVELHHGKVFIDSEPGQGTIVHLSFPADDENRG